MSETETQAEAREMVTQIRDRALAINEMTTVEQIRTEVASILLSSTMLALHMDRMSERLTVVETTLVKILFGASALGDSTPQAAPVPEKAYEIVNGKEGRFNPGGYL